MTIDKALTIMEVEEECVRRNIKGCNRDCGNCDLVQKDQDLLDAFATAKRALKIVNKLQEVSWQLKI